MLRKFVMAGPLVMDLARRRQARLLPVDSEHSAVFQALQAGGDKEVRRIRPRRVPDAGRPPTMFSHVQISPRAHIGNRRYPDGQLAARCRHGQSPEDG